MAGLFISYRRDDSRGFAGRVADDLSDVFGEDRVFRDVEIPVGSDFAGMLHRTIAASDALLVIIGRHWADASTHDGGRRLFEPSDWVRIEIEAALDQEKHVIPILVDEARMPAPEELPESIAPLVRRQAAVLSDRRWEDDMAHLAVQLRQLCPGLAVVAGRDDGRSSEESPADVLREMGDRILDQVDARRAPRPASPGLFGAILHSVAGRAGRFLGSAFTLAVAACVLYVGLRLFGDAETLRALDRVEARLELGWQRLLGYLRQL